MKSYCVVPAETDLQGCKTQLMNLKGFINSCSRDDIRSFWHLKGFLNSCSQDDIRRLLLDIGRLRRILCSLQIARGDELCLCHHLSYSWGYKLGSSFSFAVIDFFVLKYYFLIVKEKSIR